MRGDLWSALLLHRRHVGSKGSRLCVHVHAHHRGDGDGIRTHRGDGGVRGHGHHDHGRSNRVYLFLPSYKLFFRVLLHDLEE